MEMCSNKIPTTYQFHLTLLSFKQYIHTYKNIHNKNMLLVSEQKHMRYCKYFISEVTPGARIYIIT